MLQDVYCFVRDDFRRSRCPAAVRFGAEFIAENADPVEGSNVGGGRVVFVPTSDGAYLAPLATRGAGIPPPSMSAGANPQAVMRRVAGCEIHIWGAAQRQEDGTQQLLKDYDVTDALINQTALSLYRAGGAGVVSIAGGRFEKGPLHVRRGFVYVMNVRVEIPIVDIDFPCTRIDENTFTWLTESGVVASATVEMRESLPTGPLMDSVVVRSGEA